MRSNAVIFEKIGNKVLLLSINYLIISGLKSIN